MPTATWTEWLFGTGPPKFLKPSDAAHDPTLRARFITLLDNTDPPASFKASEVAQSLSVMELRKLGYDKWDEALPAVKELAWELRAFGDVEILKGGRIIPMDVDAWEVEGGVRIRRKEGDGDGLYE